MVPERDQRFASRDQWKGAKLMKNKQQGKSGKKNKRYHFSESGFCQKFPKTIEGENQKGYFV